jgi:hypothetical protein
MPFRLHALHFRSDLPLDFSFIDFVRSDVYVEEQLKPMTFFQSLPNERA